MKRKPSIRKVTPGDTRSRWLREYQRARRSNRVRITAVRIAARRMGARIPDYALGYVSCAERLAISCAIERGGDLRASILRNFRSSAAFRAHVRRVAPIPQPWGHV